MDRQDPPPELTNGNISSAARPDRERPKSDSNSNSLFHAKIVPVVPLAPQATKTGAPKALISIWSRFKRWTIFGGIAILLVVGFIVLYRLHLLPSLFNASQAASPSQLTPLATSTSTTSATVTSIPKATATLRSRSVIILSGPTTTPTPVPDGYSLTVYPNPKDMGWVVSDDETTTSSYAPPNHFGDSFLYAGVLGGNIYHTAFLFDLSYIPRGTKIHQASLRLTGLRDDLLNQEINGAWTLSLLAPNSDHHWRNLDYAQVDRAKIWHPLLLTLKTRDLGLDQANLFEFTADQLDSLERRLYEGDGRLSFRLSGPVTGENNLFAWDSGHNDASQGVGPELFLSLGPAPPTPPPPYQVIITSTPTPETVFVAATHAVKLTAEATRFGTATPLPPSWVTPVVVTNTPRAENRATARAMRRLATVIALTTPQPFNMQTATPTPPYVIITSVPTPENVVTAAARVAQITAEATRVGTATPLPPNWVTPVVVTSTPTPANQATVLYQQAIVLTTGTPLPTPGNVQTATPTEVFIWVDLISSPTPTVTPSPVPQQMPSSLIGKILFLSDREGASEAERQRAGRLRVTPIPEPHPFVYDPVTGKLGRLTEIWPHTLAISRDAWSPQVRYEAYNQIPPWSANLSIFYYDHLNNEEQVVTHFGRGIAYHPVWSPTHDEIAYIATESGNDEIWVIRQDGSENRQLTINTWEWDKSPSWSPDGQQIVFYSNRTGKNQLWIMNRDGSDQRLLMASNPYNDWDPVWVKYAQPAPPSIRELRMRNNR